MRSLLDEDPTLLEREDDRTNRPLAVAAQHGHLGVVRLLIDKDADISATGHWGKMALHYAAEEGNEEVVACLMEHGAQANSRDEDGMTPLMMAAVEGHRGVVNMLVQHMEGQGLDDRDDRGNTLLHQVAYGGHDQVLRILLVAGADPTMSNNAGRTPRAVAEQPEDYPHSSMRRYGRARCVRVFEVRADSA
jgi:ankyrin repeat protein